MDKTVAIIDLGSNTFHLLISKIGGGKFEEVFRKRVFVGLAEGGIETIKESALIRAKEAFFDFHNILVGFDIAELKIMGTAALRSASNATQVDQMVQSIFGQSIEIIDGKREAELIYKGVSLLVDTNKGAHLIMDIGGGSTEFIIVQNGMPRWSQSYNIGVAVLHEMFHKTEPISEIDIDNLHQFLSTTLFSLREQLEHLDIENLIGASGSFEVVVAMKGKKLSSSAVQSFDPSEFSSLEEKVVTSDFNTRANLDGMPVSRVKLIVVAFILMKHIINITNPKHIVVSPYALKEGIISEMM